ncbi:hypothetical protein AB0M12_43435 [Nocardia vinacea]|uniref:hypothetical protein n=1 Tax=Nocardia vinacea TaxID=96468 RepID=UPI003434B76C
MLEHGVEGSTGVPTSVLPADHARGLLDHLRDADRQAGLSEVAADTHSTPPPWACANWLHLRLAGLCLQPLCLKRAQTSRPATRECAGGGTFEVRRHQRIVTTRPTR